MAAGQQLRTRGLGVHRVPSTPRGSHGASVDNQEMAEGESMTTGDSAGLGAQFQSERVISALKKALRPLNIWGFKASNFYLPDKIWEEAFTFLSPYEKLILTLASDGRSMAHLGQVLPNRSTKLLGVSAHQAQLNLEHTARHLANHINHVAEMDGLEGGVKDRLACPSCGQPIVLSIRVLPGPSPAGGQR